MTSPEGIDYHQEGYQLRVAWRDVERVGKMQVGRMEREGLFVQNGIGETNGLYRLIHGRTLKDAHQRFIPFTPLMPKWRENALGQAIRQYAPHVFAETSLGLHDEF